MGCLSDVLLFFFFNDTATTDIYTLSLHDALPIDPDCPGHTKTKSPETEVTIALPKWAIGWDVFCWIGHRRCSRHMAIPLIRSELLDDYAIKLSEVAIDT